MTNPSTSNPLILRPNFTLDPTIPQSVQQSAEQINDATKAQVNLINATTTGGRRRRRKSRRSYRGGVGGVGAATIPGDPTTIVVAPLPLVLIRPMLKQITLRRLHCLQMQ